MLAMDLECWGPRHTCLGASTGSSDSMSPVWGWRIFIVQEAPVSWMFLEPTLKTCTTSEVSVVK